MSSSFSHFMKLIIFIFYINRFFSMVVIPFKHNIPKQNTNIYEYHLNEEVYTEILIGNPLQSIKLNLSPIEYRFYIAQGECYVNAPSYYDYNKSKSFEFSTKHVSPFKDISQGIFAYDSISVFANLNLTQNHTLNRFRFFLGRKNLKVPNSKEFCGIIGLSIIKRNVEIIWHDDDLDSDYGVFSINTFISSMKQAKFINNYLWTYEYFNKEKNEKNIAGNKNIIDNYDGVIILGEYPHNFNPNEFNETKIGKFYTEKSSSQLIWNMKFDGIYYTVSDINNLESKEKDFFMNKVNVDLLFNVNYIYVTKEFFDSIISNYFRNYLNKKYCMVNYVKEKSEEYQIITCDKNTFTMDDIKKFPTIKFLHRIFHYTFFLSYDELFDEINGKITFLMMLKTGNSDKWTFGKLFLKKYKFSFNQDQNTIFFYKNTTCIPNNKANMFKNLDKSENIKERNNENNIFKYIFTKINIIWICITIITLISGLYIGKKILPRNRKTRANELDDNFEYQKNEKDINSDNRENQIIEMNTKTSLLIN